VVLSLSGGGQEWEVLPGSSAWVGSGRCFLGGLPAFTRAGASPSGEGEEETANTGDFVIGDYSKTLSEGAREKQSA